jgi:hypothetical protein
VQAINVQGTCDSSANSGDSSTRLLCYFAAPLPALHICKLLCSVILSTQTLLQVHERSIEIDLLLLLLRDVVIRRATAGTAGTTQPSGTTTPLRLILMSATADADLFATYMHQRLAPAASASSNNKKGAAGGGNAGLLSGVAQLTIPGFTHPVRVS